MRVTKFKILVFLISLRLSTSQTVQFDAREATIDSVHDSLFSGQLNGKVNAIITLNKNVLTLADSLDDMLAKGNATGSLFCIPILLKDNYDTADMATTGGNVALADSQPTVDAPVVAVLRRAGAIILGKANMHEMALEGLSVSSEGGQIINPYDSTRTPGGSSGGSGAAVAASFSVWATGTDTVNSLRSPASANSLFSIRPTRGCISRAGIIPVSFTQDVLGPIARTVKDVATALTVMASVGLDVADNATALVPRELVGKDYAATITEGSLQDLRLGLLTNAFNRTSSNETDPVNEAMDAYTRRLSSAGTTVIPINESTYDLPKILATLDTQRFEYRESMDEYLSRPTLQGTHPNTLAELYARSTTGGGRFVVIPPQYEYITTALASSTSNATYADVQLGIRNLQLTLQETFTRHNLDAIIYPEQKNLVVKIGSPSQSGRNGILAALTGSPVVTVPVGFSPKSEDAPVGVPIGMEILGRPWQEEKLLQMAYQMEILTHVRRPPVWAEGVLEVRHYESVPSVTPDRGNISPVYPLGVL